MRPRRGRRGASYRQRKNAGGLRWIGAALGEHNAEVTVIGLVIAAEEWMGEDDPGTKGEPGARPTEMKRLAAEGVI